MRRWSSILLLVMLAMAALAVASFHPDDSPASQSSQAPDRSGGTGPRGESGGPQGWPGTPPSPEPPLEPKAPATVKEGAVWIPPLPTMESVAPPAGWVTSGPDVPPMPLTLLRLPRTNITRAKFPAIDFHVHARELTTRRSLPELHHADGLDRHGRHRQSERRHRNNTRHGAEGGRAVPGSRRQLHHLQPRRDQRTGLVAEIRRRDGARLQGGRARHEGLQGARTGGQEPRRQLHPGRRPATRSDLGDGREARQADHDPHQRLDRPLLSDRPEERALRSRPVASSRRHVRESLPRRAALTK